jgi:hypothetical protein
MIPRTPETVREASFAVKHALAPGNRGGWKATEPLRWVNFCGAGSAGKLLGTGLMELGGPLPVGLRCRFARKQSIHTEYYCGI